MYTLTIMNNNSDPRGEELNGVFDTIPDMIAHLLSKYSGITKLTIAAQGPTKWNVNLIPILSSYNFVMQEVSLRELADRAKEILGLETYDTALPITWCDSVKKETGEWPYGFVWGYSKGIFGFPIPLTPKAIKLLERYSNAVK